MLTRDGADTVATNASATTMIGVNRRVVTGSTGASSPPALGLAVPTIFGVSGATAQIALADLQNGPGEGGALFQVSPGHSTAEANMTT